MAAVQALRAVVRVAVTGDLEPAVPTGEVFFGAPEGQGHGSGIVGCSARKVKLPARSLARAAKGSAGNPPGDGLAAHEEPDRQPVSRLDAEVAALERDGSLILRQAVESGAVLGGEGLQLAERVCPLERTRLRGGFLFPLLVVFGRFGLSFRPVHGSGRVFCRSVDGVELHSFSAGVAEVVAGAGRNEDEVACGDGLGLPVDDRLSTAGSDDQDLVYGMRLFADIFTGQQAHEHDLAVLAGADLPAEVFAVSAEARDVFDVGHRKYL